MCLCVCVLLEDQSRENILCVSFIFDRFELLIFENFSPFLLLPSSSHPSTGPCPNSLQSDGRIHRSFGRRTFRSNEKSIRPPRPLDILSHFPAHLLLDPPMARPARSDRTPSLGVALFLRHDLFVLPCAHLPGNSISSIDSGRRDYVPAAISDVTPNDRNGSDLVRVRDTFVRIFHYQRRGVLGPRGDLGRILLRSAIYWILFCERAKGGILRFVHGI